MLPEPVDRWRSRQQTETLNSRAGTLYTRRCGPYSNIQHSFQLGEPQSVAALLSADTHMQVLICLPRGSRYGRIKERNHWTLKHVAGERILRADPPARDSAEKGTGLGHCQSHTQFLLLYSIPEFPNIFCQMSPGLSRIKTCK